MWMIAWLSLLGCSSMLMSRSEPKATHAPEKIQARLDAAPAKGGLDTGTGEEKALQLLGYVEEEQEEADDEVRRDRAASIKEAHSRARVRKERGDKNAQASPPAPPKSEPEPEPARERSWFPEAFMWQPRVVTDAQGKGSVSVTVPDSLTEWRVLGLAHDRAGHQAGAEHLFQGTLPVYVEPATPGYLFDGDRFQLPVQVMNTTQQAQFGQLSVVAAGGLQGGNSLPITLSAGASTVAMVPLVASGHGSGKVQSTFGDLDTAIKRIELRPTGRPVQQAMGGGLSSERSLVFDALGAEPTSERLEVTVFPGPLSVMQLELERLMSGGVMVGPEGFAAARHVSQLSEATGAEVSDDALRRLRIVAWQGTRPLIRNGLSVQQAAATLLALGDGADHALAEASLPMLRRQVADAQSPDGTWTGPSQIDAVLRLSALSVMALSDDEGARRRAAGAFERYISDCNDPFTASMLLATGLLDGAVRQRVDEIFRTGIVKEKEVFTLNMAKAKSAVDRYGASRSEQLTFALLALAPNDPAAADLAAELMGNWSAQRGFGLVGLESLAYQALAKHLPPLADSVAVELVVDGAVVSTANLDPSQPKAPALLLAKPGQSMNVRLAKPQPGLTFTATRTAWLPWTDQDRLPGVEATVSGVDWKVGQEGALTWTISAPSKSVVTLVQPLVAGTSVNEASLATQPGINAFKVWPDRVEVTTTGFGPGEIKTLVLGLTPAYAGVLQTGPVELRANQKVAKLKPPVWKVNR